MTMRETRKAVKWPEAKAPSHECGVPGCPERVAKRHLMCAEHWWETPRELRSEVFATLSQWVNGETNAFPYLRARLKAIIHVGKLHGAIVANHEADLARIEERMKGTVQGEANGH